MVLLAVFPWESRAQVDFTRQLLSSQRYEVQPTKKKSTRAPASASKNEPIKLDAAPVQVTVPQLQKVVDEPEAIEEPGILDQARSLLANDKEDKIDDFYRDYIQKSDPRLNKVEIDFAPGYTAIDSRSNFSYRNYQSSFSSMLLGSNVWLSPGIAITGAMRFSLGGSLRADPTNGSMDAVRDESFELGFRLRHFFGLLPTSKSVEFSALYLDHAFNVSNDSTSHPRTRTSGFVGGVKAILPTSADHAFMVGGRFGPRLRHQEFSTSVSVDSGNSAENILFGLDLGGELRLNRKNELIYSFGMSTERNLFSGSASRQDPQSGQTPSNVTVTNTVLNFSLGYRWSH